MTRDTEPTASGRRGRISLQAQLLVIIALVLVVGIATGVAHRAWMPTLGGLAINLSLMYMAIQEIRRRRKQLGLNQTAGDRRDIF